MARNVATAVSAPFVSVGELIRARAARDGFVAAAYAGKNGFSDEFIYDLLRVAVAEQAQTLVMEGSIGMGLAIERLQRESCITTSDAVLLYCPSFIRRARFEQRQAGRSRIEALTFFDDRERLFDARLPHDIAALKAAGHLYELDGAQPIDEVCGGVLSLLTTGEV